MRTHGIEQVVALGDIVAVWAHPDDESYLAAGVMAIARANGARVTCVTATDGELADSERNGGPSPARGAPSSVPHSMCSV